MKNKSELRKLTGKMIYIDNGYTLKEQQTQRSIRKGGVEKRKSWGSDIRNLWWMGENGSGMTK